VADPNLLSQLLARWEEARELGESVSPEDLCAEHPELLPEVRRKIDALRALDSVLRTEPGDPAAPRPPRIATPKPPIQVPGYDILGVLGRGGMGIVYQARQVHLDRVVALKMVLAGAHASAEDLARFKAEAEAVARLQHPNIVQIHEVGEHEGRAFFSLEYVEGGSLAHKVAGNSLAARAAARVVEVLAGAVQYAHRRGIVHRDLKPQNVLLTADDTPKITDFGLAKRVDAPGQTQTGAILGTPSYMAPEQAAGRTNLVGPSADVYALGAILYNLLTGRPPFLAESAWETVTQVMGQDPVPPRRLQPKVPADLETICLKCLHKEPHRRYARAVDLAEDLRRFLAGEPIRARPVRVSERTIKWARRNPLAAGLLTTVILLIIVGFVVVTSLWRRAVGSAEEAERAKDRAVVALAAESKARTKAVEALAAEARAKKLEAQQRAEAERKHRLALQVVDVTRQVVDVFGVKVSGSPALKGEAMAPLRKALLQLPAVFYKAYAGLRYDDPDFVAEQGKVLCRLGAIQADTGSLAEAVASYSEAIQVFERLHRAHPDRPGYLRRLAAIHSDRALLQQRLRRFDDSRKGLDEGLALSEKLVRTHPGVAEYEDTLATCLNNRGSLHAAEGQPDRADAAYRRARGLWEKLAQGHPKQLAYQNSLAASYNNEGLVLQRKGRLSQAEQAYRKAGDLWERLVQRSPRERKYQLDLARTRYNLARLLGGQGQADEARTTYTRAVDMCQTLTTQFPAVPDYANLLALALEGRGHVAWKQGEDAPARADFEAAVALWEGLTRGNPAANEYTPFLARASRDLGELQLRAGRGEASESAFARWVSCEEGLHRADPGRAGTLARACCRVGHALRSRKRLGASLPYYERALAVGQQAWERKKEAQTQETLEMAHWGRALSLAGLGRHAEAMTNWDRALELNAKGNPDEIRMGRAESLGRLGRHAEAAAQAKRLAGKGLPAWFSYEVARVFALAGRAVQADETISLMERARLTDEYATGAIDALERARAAGYFHDPTRRARLQTDPDLAGLHGRERFQRLSHSVNDNR
jgi:serine/threonine-protein kinase